MKVHKVISDVVAGFGYDRTFGHLRVVLHPCEAGDPCAAYDYFGVSEEDAGIFTNGLGKKLNYIKQKYGDTAEKVENPIYHPDTI